MANSLGVEATNDAINLTATNVRATVTIKFDAVVTSPDEMYDAAANNGLGAMTNSMDVSSPEMRYEIHAGYTQGGVFAYDQIALDPPGDPYLESVDEVRTIRVRNGAIQLLDINGQAVTEGGPGLQTILSAASSDPLYVLEGVVLTQLPTAGSSTARSGVSSSVTSVTQAGTTATVVSAIQPTMAGEEPLTQTRVYQVKNGQYILYEVLTDVSRSAQGFQVTGQARVRFTEMTWAQVPASDHMRASAPAGSVWGSEADNAREPMIPYCDPLANPDCEIPPGTPVLPPNPPNANCPLDPEGANVLYVHGIRSEGPAWGSPMSNTRVRGRARCGLRIAWDDAPTLDRGGSQSQGGTQSHTGQTAELASTIPATTSGLIFVGHSQGGLISRRVAQTTAFSGRTRAVVTTGTPHYGAHIARTLDPGPGISGVVNVLAAPLGNVLTGGSTLGSLLTYWRDSFLAGYFNSPGMSDLRPDSPAIAQVNAQASLNSESAFARYGIQNSIRKRWAFARVAGDAHPDNRGDFAVSVVEGAFWGSVVGSIVAVVVGSPGAAAILARIALEIDRTDRWWTRITVGSDRTDGVVSLTSQHYPQATLNVPARRVASHSGQIDTGNSYVSIAEVLRENVGVQGR